MEKVTKQSEKMIDTALASKQLRTETFNNALTSATDSTQELSTQCLVLNNMLRFKRNTDRTELTQAQAQQQYNACKICHTNAMESYTVLKSLLRG